jgi:hypothetical protein
MSDDDAEIPWFDPEPDDEEDELPEQLPEDLQADLWMDEVERRENRNPEQWWDEYFEPLSDHGPIPATSGALKTLIRAGCSRGRLLTDFREIEELSYGIELRNAGRRLARSARLATALSKELDVYENSSILLLYPPNYVSSESLQAMAVFLKQTRKKIARNQRPLRQRVIDQVTMYVDLTVKQRGTVGKRAADQALATIIAALTSERRTADAQRVARTRLLKKKGRQPRVPNIKRAKRFAGSGARRRKRTARDSDDRE